MYSIHFKGVHHHFNSMKYFFSKLTADHASKRNEFNFKHTLPSGGYFYYHFTFQPKEMYIFINCKHTHTQQKGWNGCNLNTRPVIHTSDSAITPAIVQAARDGSAFLSSKQILQCLIHGYYNTQWPETTAEQRQRDEADIAGSKKKKKEQRLKDNLNGHTASKYSTSGTSV